MSTATAPVFASAQEAMAMVHAGLAYIATADATAMSAAERARCLREMEQADAVATAARTSVLGAFAAGQDYADDGDYSACSWLIHRTQGTKGTAVDHTGWVKRGVGHPLVMAALAGKAVSKSYAREICRREGRGVPAGQAGHRPGGRRRSGYGVRRPDREVVHHPRRGRNHPRRADSRVRRVRADRARRPVRAGRRGR